MNYYDDGIRYDLDYGERTEDIDFYIDQCKKINSDILELGCGTGRISIPLANNEKHIIALDNNSSMLKVAKKKINKTNYTIDFILQDFTKPFDLNKKVECVIMPFNSFQHVYSLKEAECVLNNVKNHLKKDGLFIFDIINPDLTDLGRGFDSVYVYDVYYISKDPETGTMKRLKPDEEKSFKGHKSAVVVEDIVDYDDTSQIAKFSLFYSIGEDKETFTSTLIQRFYFPQELEILMHYNGFKVLNKYGDFKKNEFVKNSASQILVCKKI